MQMFQIKSDMLQQHEEKFLSEFPCCLSFLVISQGCESAVHSDFTQHVGADSSCEASTKVILFDGVWQAIKEKKHWWNSDFLITGWMMVYCCLLEGHVWFRVLR